MLLRNHYPQMWNIHNLLRICRNKVNLTWRHRGGAVFCSKLWCTRRQRITDTCNTGGGRACARSVTGSSVSLATCGRELLCARRCCPCSARCGGRKPRGTREPSKTTLTPAPTDWWVNRLQLQQPFTVDVTVDKSPLSLLFCNFLRPELILPRLRSCTMLKIFLLLQFLQYYGIIIRRVSKLNRLVYSYIVLFVYLFIYHSTVYYKTAWI